MFGLVDRQCTDWRTRPRQGERVLIGHKIGDANLASDCCDDARNPTLSKCSSRTTATNLLHQNKGKVAQTMIRLRQRTHSPPENDTTSDDDSQENRTIAAVSCRTPRTKRRKYWDHRTDGHWVSRESPASFQDFRTTSLNEYPSLSFLGPASMAVVWFKEYLKTERFGWMHIPNPRKKDR